MNHTLLKPDINPALLERENYFSMEVTTRCNNARCTYCFAQASLDTLEHMDPETAVRALEEARRNGYSMLHLTGGEPTLWPWFESLVERAVGLGYRHILVNTNGMRLKQRTLDLFTTYGSLLDCSITLNGPEPIHEMTRGRGTYAQVIRGIRNILETGAGLRIFTVATRQLLPHIPGFVQDLFHTFPGIKDMVLIQLHRTTGDSADLRHSILNESQFTELVQMAGLLSAYGYPLRFLDNPLTTVMAGLMELPHIPSPPLIREGRLTLMRDGKITGAHSSRNSYGEYSPGVLEEILLSSDYLESCGPDLFTCTSCRHRERCLEGGMVRPSEIGRDYGSEQGEPFCRRVLDHILRRKRVTGVA